MTVSDNVIAELTRLEAAATPGPWAIRHDTNIFANRSDVGHEGSVANTGGHSSNQVDCNVENFANAELIAAMRNALPALLSELSSLRARVRQLLSSCKKSIPDSAVCVFRDGNKWCCVRGDFINLQESPAGFGNTFEEALDKLDAGEVQRG